LPLKLHETPERSTHGDQSTGTHPDVTIHL
jgi:hypothetical protein